MGDVSFIKRLVDYDKDGITPLIQKKLQKYIMDPNFLPEIVQKQSAAATSLCMWVRAMDVYANVNKIVAPKKEVSRILRPEKNVIPFPPIVCLLLCRSLPHFDEHTFVLFLCAAGT